MKPLNLLGSTIKYFNELVKKKKIIKLFQYLDF